MTYKTAAILPNRGIGDALLMMIAAHRLLQEGYQVTTHHPALLELQEWFPGHTFSSAPCPDEASDLIIVQNDNSPKIHSLKTQFVEKLAVFYPTYQKHRHPPLTPLDQVFQETKPMAENIAYAIARLLKSNHMSKNNGLVVPAGLTFQAHPKRIIIHPTSSEEAKNWCKNSYLRLARRLRRKGFYPVFALSPTERGFWMLDPEEGIETPLFPTLSSLAKMLYESRCLIGNDSLLGHLASNLHIPTFVIANSLKRMQLWRPGWLLGEVITPPKWIPNPKFFRLREKYWKTFITVNRVETRCSTFLGSL